MKEVEPLVKKTEELRKEISELKKAGAYFKDNYYKIKEERESLQKQLQKSKSKCDEISKIAQASQVRNFRVESLADFGRYILTKYFRPRCKITKKLLKQQIKKFNSCLVNYQSIEKRLHKKKSTKMLSKRCK